VPFYNCAGTRGGLGPKSLRGKRIYKSHSDFAEKALHHFKIPLKMYLKSLAILKEALIFSGKVFKNN
jgi:hypothetical protein